MRTLSPCLFLLILACDKTDDASSDTSTSTLEDTGAGTDTEVDTVTDTDSPTDTGSSTDTGSPTDTDTETSIEIETDYSYAIVETNQTECYDESGNTGCPGDGETFYGQDAQYSGLASDYTDNSDGTITDWNTGLVWQKEQLNGYQWGEAEDYCTDLTLGGITSWRVPSTKELYSLIDYSGTTGSSSGDFTEIPDDAEPFINDTFDFSYGDTSAGERYIDTQFISATVYVSNIWADNNGQEAGAEGFFGVNYADGRIKGYETANGAGWQLRCVSGNTDYGTNDFEDQGDGTVADYATGLMWTQDDSMGLDAGPTGDGELDWALALDFCEELSLGGHDDWRLPDAKALHSIVDYTRSPDTTGSAAIDPVFEASSFIDEAGDTNYGFYWTSTTLLDGPGDAIYIAFGEGLGYTVGPDTGAEMFMDVHGAGSQRSDPKVGDPADYPTWGNGPQGDVERVHNLARCVRDAAE